MTRNENDKIAKRSYFSRNVLPKFFLSAFTIAVLSAGLFMVPADATACTSEPVCPFDAQQGRIIVDFGNMIRSDKTESDAVTGPYSVNIPAGTYDVSFSSYDNHSSKPTQVQVEEMWYAVLKNSQGTVVSSTAPISDLPDDENYIEEKVEAEYAISEDVSVVVIRHWAYDFPPNTSANSITPVCAAFDEILEPEPITVVAAKITCENEEDLPDWGKGPSHGPSITDLSVATNWVYDHLSCSFTPQWGFQWAPGNVSNPGDNTGEAAGSWTTFGPTDENGIASTTVEESQLDGTNKIWMREITMPGYLGFFGNSVADGTIRESAEMYCYNDVLKYDNYDYINNPEAGETYYCVAFNTLEEQPPIEGCTDSSALNYDEDAEVDDGSCDYCTNLEDEDGIPEGWTRDDQGVCSEPPVDICEDETALNYGEEGECEYYAPYCGDGIVNQDWEQCDNTDPQAVGCSAQCEYVVPQCRDLVLARVNVDDVQNWDNGDMTSDLFLGSADYRIPQGVWFALYWDDFLSTTTNPYFIDSDIESYEDVPGLAIQRLEGQIRTRIYGTHPSGTGKEYVSGDIEFYRTDFSSFEDDNVGNNKLENWHDGTGVGSYNAGNDEMGDPEANSFWLTVTTADDSFYTNYGELELCDVCPNIEGDQKTVPDGMIIDDYGNCITPTEPTFGCTDPSAKNYDPGATDEDGSCEYYQCSDGLDNDGDGDIDYPDDSGCDDPTDDDENSPPVITLVGDNPLLLTVGDTYTDPGATADDVEDGDITGDIVVGGDTVDTSTSSSYTVTYNVTDSDGAAADEVTREVVVSETPPTDVCPNLEGLQVEVPEGYELVDGMCVEIPVEPIPGCTDPSANNYDSGATEDDGSCTYGGPAPNPGCTDPVATNYNPAATWNDDSCEYPGPAPVYQCSDDIDNDEDNLIDEDDPGCHTDGDVDNPDSYEPTDDDEVNPEVLPAETCNYLLEYIKFGADNNPVEVLKLQKFLKDYEGFENVPLSGFYDQTTYDAVSKFQMRYFEDVLSPWGHDGPTGYVYITTKKKVNELYCERPFPLTSGQKDEIDGFKNLLSNLQTKSTLEEIKTKSPEIFEEIGQAPADEIEIQGGEATITLAQESEEGAEGSENTSLVSDVDLADIQLLAELGEKEEMEKTEKSKQETLLAALNFVVDNRLIAALIALAVFFFFSIFMIWKKTKPENPTYF